ncbi:hypothetical protein SSS_08249 [Sarcoptes scabiei]|uniref:Purine nucleoside phosphorylase n=1 Tax=Sarcoptes scabiei TaxID=52283 RepID=A0A132A8C1_SARSC|nr:hypothetical protein SSS_08249 [Sarcoptes scabiei]KPM07218.1 purine nucleoside phosphorylase-like protein [Sarcoptes scabiei]UXI18863.1 testis-specific serine/threonine-protein kinase 4 [Sarcoptes scabiei]
MEQIILSLKAFLNQSKVFSVDQKLSPTKSSPRKKKISNDECIQYDEVMEICKYLQSKITIQPVLGIICGSGLGGLSDLILDAKTIDYKNIPYFPVSTVAGHHGSLVFGYLKNVPVVCMKGRIHSYEGYSLARCTLPVRVMRALGVKTLIVTNAAGGLNDDYNVSDIMIIKDHVFFPGFSGNNPLRGPNDQRFGPRFPPMNTCYDRKLIEIAEQTAEKLGIDQYIRKGVYGMLGGPNFETIAEARFLQHAGIDAVGMSTAHEAIVAHHSGMQVLGFSLITNKIIKDYHSNDTANHEEVLEAAKNRAKEFESMIEEIVGNLNLQ